MSSSIIPIDQEWLELLTTTLESITEQEAPGKVIEAAELLLTGYPVYQVAEKLNERPDTIRRWISSYPALAAAVSNGKELLTQWRMWRLEKQFLDAVNLSEKILSIDLTGTLPDEETKVNSKLVGTLAQHARFIISLFASQKSQVDVTHHMDLPTLKATQGALDYLADKLKDMDAVTVEYTVHNPAEHTPLLDKNGDPIFGEAGKLTTDEAGNTQRHICGGVYSDFYKHVATHGVSKLEYKNLFLLDDTV